MEAKLKELENYKDILTTKGYLERLDKILQEQINNSNNQLII